MFGDINRIELMGNLTNDPELRHTASGTPVTSFGIAVNRRYLSGDEWKEEVQFINIVLWADRAKSFVERAKKGTRVWVEGRLTIRSYDDKEGRKQYRTEVVATRVILIDRYIKPENSNFGNDSVPEEDKKSKPVKTKSQKPSSDETIDPDELPF